MVKFNIKDELTKELQRFKSEAVNQGWDVVGDAANTITKALSGNGSLDGQDIGGAGKPLVINGLKATPVAETKDAGTARSGWYIDYDNAEKHPDNHTFANMAANNAKAAGARHAKPKRLVISNDVVYIGVLEYGAYKYGNTRRLNAAHASRQGSGFFRYNLAQWETVVNKSKAKKWKGK